LKQTHMQTPYKQTKIEIPTYANLKKSTKKHQGEQERAGRKSLPFWVTPKPKASKP